MWAGNSLPAHIWVGCHPPDPQLRVGSTFKFFGISPHYPLTQERRGEAWEPKGSRNGGRRMNRTLRSPLSLSPGAWALVRRELGPSESPGRLHGKTAGYRGRCPSDILPARRYRVALGHKFGPLPCIRDHAWGKIGFCKQGLSLGSLRILAKIMGRGVNERPFGGIL